MLQSLTGLRFYAALLVFLSHLYLFNYFAGISDGKLHKILSEMGWVGVSLFFTLSGFVLFINYFNPAKRTHLDLRSFYLARFARIYPVFLFATLLSVPLEWCSPKIDAFWLPLAMNLGLIHCFDAYACSAFTEVGWSLSHEAVFYVLFPILGLLFVGPKPLQRVGLTLLVFLLYLIVVAVVFPGSFYLQGSFALNRIAEFLLGMTAGWLFLKYRHHPGMKTWMCHPVLWFCLAIVITASLVLMSLRSILLGGSQMSEQLGFLLYAIPAFVVILSLSLMDSHQRVPAFLTHSWIRVGGEISYCFYLIHHLLMRYTLHLALIFPGIDLRKLNPVQGLPVFFVLLTISLISAYLMHHLIEKPARHWIIEKFNSKNNKETASTAAVPA